MLILIYVIEALFGVFSGYVAANEGDFEHVTTAWLVYFATLVAFIGAVISRFDQFLFIFLVWLIVAFIAHEAFRIFYRIRDGDV